MAQAIHINVQGKGLRRVADLDYLDASTLGRAAGKKSAAATHGAISNRTTFNIHAESAGEIPEAIVNGSVGPFNHPDLRLDAIVGRMTRTEVRDFRDIAALRHPDVFPPEDALSIGGKLRKAFSFLAGLVS